LGYTESKTGSIRIMKKRVVAALMLAMVIGTVGCGAKNDDVTIIGGADGPTSVFLASKTKDSVISGTWQTASIGYEVDGELQPEYYVQFTDAAIIYGHMADNAFEPDHFDSISHFEELEDGVYKIQAESDNGVKYTYQTAEGDPDILEYYQTWDENEFSDKYSGGASLSRCE
jgi:hypothetical protein